MGRLWGAIAAARRARADLDRPRQRVLPAFPEWLGQVTPRFCWTWPYLRLIQDQLARVSRKEIDRLAIFMPPRHGKSQLTTVRYPVWRLAQDPALRVVLGGYNQTFAEKMSRDMRKIARGQVPLSRDKNSAKEWETVAGGGVRACGVGSPPTGTGADLLVIDDPIKSREEADSEAYRERAWEWYTQDLLTRLEPGGAIVLIQTRWHGDDLAGRILGGEDAASWSVLSLPALAEEGDPLGRQPGEALCPDRYGVAALERVRRQMGPVPFAALYQQRPMPREGGLFSAAGLSLMMEAPPGPADVRAWVRAWDVGYASEGDPTAGVLMAALHSGQWVICDVERFRLPPHERDRRMKAVAERDDAMLTRMQPPTPQAAKGRRVLQLVEQPPGAGVEVTRSILARLAGHAVQAVLPRGDKAERATPLASQCGAGNVYLVRAGWNREFAGEALLFPASPNDDQIDAASHAFNFLANKVPLSVSVL
jgi:predicted phage terminase large subunit-like protein